MSTRVTITLPDELYRRAESLAHLTSREVDEVLADTIALSLPAFDQSDPGSVPVADLRDDELLVLTRLELTPEQDRQLSKLLDRQQSDKLTQSECSELLALMQTYQQQLLRKAQALHEAVRRGLHAPLGT